MPRSKRKPPGTLPPKPPPQPKVAKRIDAMATLEAYPVACGKCHTATVRAKLVPYGRFPKIPRLLCPACFVEATNASIAAGRNQPVPFWARAQHAMGKVIAGREMDGASGCGCGG